jgi:hypothetical protein
MHSELAGDQPHHGDWIKRNDPFVKFFLGAALMDSRGMESRRLQAAARRLLAGKAEPTPAAVAPSPGVSSMYKCIDVKTKAAVACQNPHTLVIIVAGMSCMMFLVSIALLLLCWSVVRQRRNERRRRESDSERSGSSAPAAAPAVVANAQAPPVDSPEFDDAVFVQLPGDEKPHFFALPKPFQAAEEHSLPDDGKTTPDADLKSDEKESRLP